MPICQFPDGRFYHGDGQVAMDMRRPGAQVGGEEAGRAAMLSSMTRQAGPPGPARGESVGFAPLALSVTNPDDY